ncbi:MAG: leucine-rich repeat domain-containing protein [Clostridia bacterium]|nr:leucine-rich repeat domain-containing protein [Clostridia bacterium]
MKKMISAVVAVIMLCLCLCSCDVSDLLKGNLSIKYKIDGDNAIVTGVPDNSTLPEIVIPDEYEGKPVTEIADFAAVNLENVTKLTIGKNVSKIGLWAMENNKKVSFIDVDDENEYFCDVDGVLYSKDMKTLIFYPLARGIEEMTDKNGKTVKGISYAIPEGVETVRTKAFYKCSELRSITLPTTLKRIEEKAFFRCSIDEIILPEGLTFIGKDAFTYCEGLTSIVIPESVKEIGEYAFYNCTSLLDVNVNSKEEELTLGKNWYPTKNGIKDGNLSVSFAE